MSTHTDNIVSLPTRKRADHRLVQRTLKSNIHCTGTGLHSGRKVSLTLVPAAPDTGIEFVRTDLEGGFAVIPARWDHVVDTRLCTVIGNEDGASIGTVEHLMAALAGCGIDNVRVMIDGPEVPIMDGSAEPFVFLIECAGIETQSAPRKQLKILKEVSVHLDGAHATLSPSEKTIFSFDIEFDSHVIGRQDYELPMGDGAFKSHLARARTFGFLHDVNHLQANGLALGGSLDNAVVISGDRILNETGLRFANEFVRHKLLDSIGDLFLTGTHIIGRFHGSRSGHTINNQLLHALYADPSAWRLVDDGNVEAIHPSSAIRATA
ncbi:MAG: UDP-3-O-acyl-N-acetylglucosamine deacetylase [Pseudomonadota bacterium]|nr:UDP-3-O-acyl-N-acetylglucosamine deacetylase [Pseudomonadota bacterium]